METWKASLPSGVLMSRVVRDPQRNQSLIFRVWSNEAGHACRLCPRSKCNFEPTLLGIGTCCVQVEGLVDDDSGLLPLPSLRILRND
jgi:hypothetical protein